MQRGTALMKNSTHNSSKPPSTHSSSCEFAERELFWNCSQGMKPQHTRRMWGFQPQGRCRKSQHTTITNKLHRPTLLRICRAGAILKLLAGAETAAYSTYVRISATRQMPKEPRSADSPTKSKKNKVFETRTPYNRSNLLDYLFFLS